MIERVCPGVRGRLDANNFTLENPIPLGGPNPVLSVRGRYSACDVWVRAPRSWCVLPSAVEIALYAINGSARVIIARANLAGNPAFETIAASGDRSSIPVGVRGRSCDGFELVIASSDGLPLLEPADLFLEVWGEDATNTR